MLFTLFLVNLGIITAFATQYSSYSQQISVLSVGFAFAFAALIFGYFIGFIFGLPRTHPQESRSFESNNFNNTSNEERSTQYSLYSENSNLENISDWLSKILVGVGLIQLTLIPTYLHKFTEFIEPALSGQQANMGIIGTPILVSCLFDGFLIGYLWTRCYAPTEFGKKRSELQNMTYGMKTAKQDYEVISFVNLILNQDTKKKEVKPSIDHEDLGRRIREASEGTKAYIYFLTKEQRRGNWERNKQKIELTIPIFRALIVSNPKDYRYHGQLGFTLKDQENPNWKEALNELDKAITMFPENEKSNYKYRLYRINRAVCNINLDPDFQNNSESKDPIKKSILEDISVCEPVEYIRDNFLKDSTKPFITWMKLNKVSMDDLNACTQ